MNKRSSFSIKYTNEKSKRKITGVNCFCCSYGSEEDGSTALGGIILALERVALVVGKSKSFVPLTSGDLLPEHDCE